MKLDFYLKWLATALLIVGTAVNSLGYYPAGPVILGLGGVVWTIVSFMWNEKSLIVTNSTLTLVTIIGLTINYA